MDIFLDIETRPCDDPDLIAEITANIRPPGSMKKFDTIQKWEQEERPQAVADAIARTSLDGAFGRVCVIGWAIDDGEPQVIVSADETDLLNDFFSHFRTVLHPDGGYQAVTKWIGHNIVGFDLPFLRKRCMVLGFRPPAQLLAAMMARHWDINVGDTMLMWDSAKDKQISLDMLCRVLDIPSPKENGIDGSKVAELFAAGAYTQLGEYCAGDIVAARRCYRALTWGE